MSEVHETADPGAAFAALMSGAARAEGKEPSEAPFGYTFDRQTGEQRPKKAAGRPRKVPSLDELKGTGAPEGPDGAPEGAPEGDGAPRQSEPPAPDRAPDDRGTRQTRWRAGGARQERAKPAPESAPAVPYRPGVICAGVNRLYRRAGKIVRAMDPDIGEAIIQAARNTADAGEPDDSVGAAWEELAKTNPRVRAFLMKCLTGGAWGQLIMAHAPIAMAILLKPGVAKHIPFGSLISSMAEPDDDTPEGQGGLPGGMTAPDAQQMADLAQAQMARMGLSVPPEVREQMAAMAGSMMNGFGPPVSRETVPRNQPQRTSRAQRRAAS